MIYIIIFILSLFFIWCGEKFKTKNKLISYIFTIIALLIPCLVAALRATTIGTDTDVYVIRLFNTALKDEIGFLHFYTHPYSNVKEPLYLFITYFASRLSNDVGLLFFFNEALVIVPIYIALLKKSKNTNQLLLGMLIFYLFFFNMSLNIARQSIALAFCVLAFTYLDEKKTSRFLIFSIISFLFHRTAAIIVVPFIIYKIIENEKISENTKFKVKFCLFILTLIGVLFFKQILNIFINIGLFSDYFSTILTKYVRNPIDFNQFNTIFYTCVYVLIYFNLDRLKDKISNYRYYKFIAIWGIALIQIGGIVQFSDRIAHYFIYPMLFTTLPKLAPENIFIYKTRKELISFIFVNILFAIYWTFWIIIQNVHETNPFILRK